MISMALISLAYIVAFVAAIGFLWSRSDRGALLSAIFLTLSLGSAMWLETRESMLFLAMMLFLLTDMVFVWFAPMFRRTKVAEAQTYTARDSLYFSQTLWVLVLLGVVGLSFIWNADWENSIHGTNKVFGPAVFAEFWTAYWPHVMAIGLLVTGVTIGSLLMVKADGEDS